MERILDWVCGGVVGFDRVGARGRRGAEKWDREGQKKKERKNGTGKKKKTERKKENQKVLAIDMRDGAENLRTTFYPISPESSSSLNIRLSLPCDTPTSC